MDSEEQAEFSDFDLLTDKNVRITYVNFASSFLDCRSIDVILDEELSLQTVQ